MAVNASDIADYEAIIKELCARIQIERKKIMEYISSIDDNWQIIFYKHVSCMSWIEIAMSIDGNNSVSAVKMAYKRFFDRQNEL